MKKLLLILIPFLGLGQVQIGQTIYGQIENDLFGVGMQISGDGNVVAVGAPLNDSNGENSGQVLVYENINDNWVQIGQAINGNADDHSNYVSISYNGSIIAVGSPFGNANGVYSGVIRTYQNQGGNWVQIGQDIPGESSGDLAADVSISGDGTILAVGAEENSENGEDSGHVRIYQFQNNNWVQISQDLDGDAAGDQFSVASLSSDGTTVAIGAELGDTSEEDAGYVRVYENQSGNWIQIGQTLEGEEEDDRFHYSSLSADGTILAIGAERGGENGADTGYVKVFENINSNWVQIGNTLYGDVSGDYFGLVSLSANGNILAVGSVFSDVNGTDSGFVRIYENQGGNWTQIGQDILGESAGNLFSFTSLSDDGETLAISGIGDTVNGTLTGILKVYDLSALLSTEDYIKSNFNLFPNPATNQFTIQLNDASVIEHVSIYNILGQEVLNSKKLTINTSKLASGTYIVELTTNQGKSTKKLIIE